MNRKGQVAIEFFAYASVFMMVVVITAASIYSIQSSEGAYYENRFMGETGYKLASAYNLVIGAGEGFYYNITIPKTILGHPYNVSFIKDKNNMIVEWNGSKGSSVYSYVVGSVEKLKFGGCINEETNDRGIIKSDVGNGEIEFINDGENITITQGGCQ